MSMTPQADLAVVGGGIIGLAVAWRARQRGLSVVVLERGAVGEDCACRVAAGMLAPVSEVEFGEASQLMLKLGVRSASLWPAFAAELGVGLRRSGTLLVAHDNDEARELERQLALRESLGLSVIRLRPSEARALEPALAPGVRLAVEAPDDDSVDPRHMLAALRRACGLAGVQIREHSPVVRLETDDECASATGVTLADGSSVRTAQVVLAAGAWSGEIGGLPAHARIPVRPVKGQILRLRDREGPGLMARVLRFEGGYLVPRDDGGYVLGATVEECGFEREPNVRGVYELLRAAREIVPGVLELQIDELSVGFRPATPDNVPVIGRGALRGLFWATGHHRNGILLAPLTAELLADVLVREDRTATPSEVDDERDSLYAYDPRRFTGKLPAMRSAPGAA
jgi:glycine oxidase